MSRRLVGAAAWPLAVAVPAEAGSSGLNAYRVKATPKNLEKLALSGFDVTEGRRRGGRIEVYGSSKQMARLERKTKLRARIVTARRGRTSAQRSAGKVRSGLAELGLSARTSAVDPTANASDAAYKVYRKYDAVPNDGHEQYTELYDRIVAQHSDIAAKVDIGESVLGRDIVAIQVTRNAQGADNGKPAVLYNALQHAREWLAGETCKRTLEYFTSWYGKDRQITRLVNERQLWFVCVNNPDGYEFTFTPGNRLWRMNNPDGYEFTFTPGNRLWRKNLREFNGQPGIQSGDGVDPNRNFPVDWGLDDEGSSPQKSSETYRGEGPASEPETQAMLNLWNMVDFEFEKNDHTAAELILYPQGWQQYTPAADDPIYTALAGDDENPAIEGFDPDLYITNGDTLDTAYNRDGILAYTPEGSEPNDPSVSGFEFEDNEGAIENEFRRHLDFSLDLAESADDPAHPESHLGKPCGTSTSTRSRTRTATRRRCRCWPSARWGTWTSSTASTVERSSRPTPLSGATASATTRRPGSTTTGCAARSPGPNRATTSRSGSSSRAASTGARSRSPTRPSTKPPTRCSCSPPRITAGRRRRTPTGSRTTSAATCRRWRTTGSRPTSTTSTRGTAGAPHPLGVLSHYEAVVWNTGDDYLTREPGQVPGTGTSRLALDEVVAVRDYLNEGGKVVLAGKHAGQQYFEGFEFRNTGFPQPNEDKHGEWCDSTEGEARDGCIAHTNDFFQYYMGAYLRVEDGGSWDDATGAVQSVVGTPPFSGAWTPEAQAGDPGAGAPTATLASTSSLLHTEAYDDFSEVIGSWARSESGPFSPHGGQQYLYSGADDEAYKRLSTQVDVPASGGTLTFFTSFDIELDWDYLFVEAAPAGSDDWTTLPDVNGHTSQGTGESCHDGGGWATLHDRLLHYQTKSRRLVHADRDHRRLACGDRILGRLAGVEDRPDPYAGQTIDLAIVHASDWAVQNLGVWLDDVTIDAGADSSTTGFEGTDLGVWQNGPALASSPNPIQWNEAPSTQTFQEGAVIGTKDLTFVDGTQYLTSPTRDTVYAGFELGTLNEADRTSFFEEVLEYFELKLADGE